MTRVNYSELGPHRPLHDIIFAGSHDAGITGGGGNVQTQHLDIGGQAAAGVRIFDLRIAARTVASQAGAPKQAAMHAFHADKKLMKNEVKTRHLMDTNRAAQITRTKLRGGAFGESLADMLQQARDFVRSPQGRSEFLLLKFDKCTNWIAIAETCEDVLGDTLYTGRGNLNTTTLQQLAGRVVVLFSPSGLREIETVGEPAARRGILGFRNLYDKTGSSAYDPGFHGLQYYGKGGTSVTKPFRKTAQNEKKQGRILEGAKALLNEEVLGMMYWTTTGMFESIETRNAGMWNTPGVQRMQRLWANGLSEWTEYRNPLHLPEGSPAIGPTRKRFLPNFVMLDFADADKCATIFQLNAMTPGELAQLQG